jgi:uncharacterized protein
VANFSDAVCDRIGRYVYRLVDPRNGHTFYVGKGTGNRVFQHVQGEIQADEEDDALTLKLGTIREIRNAGLDVIHIIHRHDIPDNAVDEVEAALIDAFPGLTNIQGGFGSGSRGPMNYKEIIDKYDLPEFESDPPEKLIFVNINAIEDRSDRKSIYDQVRYAWKLNVDRAKGADYILAVWRGVVVGAFVAERWLPAKSENFRDLNRPLVAPETRWGFHGREAESAEWHRFVGERGKRLTNESMKHVRFPIRYWKL